MISLDKVNSKIIRTIVGAKIPNNTKGIKSGRGTGRLISGIRDRKRKIFTLVASVISRVSQFGVI